MPNGMQANHRQREQATELQIAHHEWLAAKAVYKSAARNFTVYLVAVFITIKKQSARANKDERREKQMSHDDYDAQGDFSMRKTTVETMHSTNE